ncbi:MAG TPA: hypothetical protein VIK22_09665 [Candidatus Anoxymicrobiaceae bacterium]
MFAALASLGMVCVGSVGPSWSSGWTYVLFGSLIVAIIFGTWAGAVAARKGRSMQWWFIIGFFIPVLGIIIIYILRPLPASDQKAKA